MGQRRVERTSPVARALDTARSHPVATVFVLALLLRIVAVFVFAPMFSGSYVLDDGTYVDMAEDRAAGDTASWDSYTYGLFEATATFMIPLTILFRLFGPNEIIGGLFVALLGAGAAALVTRLAMEATDRWIAIAAGAIVALLPSQILWSSLVLKDAAVWIVLAGIAVAVAVAARGNTRTTISAGIAAGVLLYLLAHLRLHTLVVAAWALVIASWVGSERHRAFRVAGAVVLAVTIPWLVGAGPAGVTFVANSGNLEERRIAGAQGARTAVVVANEPTVTPGDGSGSGSGSGSRPGSGSGTETGGEPAPEDEPPATTFDPGLEHLPRGVVVMLFEPTPWSSNESLSFRLAQAETLVWYPVLALAFVGLFHARRHLRVALFPVIAGAGILLTYALAEGNVGTAYRHRGEFVWVVALLAGFGIAGLVRRRREKRTQREA